MQQELIDFELEQFRLEVRAFLREKLAPEVAERVKAGYYFSKDELFLWQRELFKKGWIGINWPKEFGGPNWTPMQKCIFEDECAKAGAPVLITLGLNQGAALLINFGTEKQKNRYLPRILDGTETWCQGFSEPGAGSDLANLKCAAKRDGDCYVINGTKIWTTAAHWADWCFLLVRTDSSGRKQEGITILIVDMKLPGITIRPIIGIDGMHSLNQVFFDDVRVSTEQRVGEENRGWDLMKVVLGTERISAAGIWKAKAHFERLCEISKRNGKNDRRLIDHPRFRDRLALVGLRLRAAEGLLLEVLVNSEKIQGIDAHVLKLIGTHLQQDILGMISEAAECYALPFDHQVLREGWGNDDPIGPGFAAPSTPFYLFWRKSSISGGASEVIRNMIAHTLLG